MPRVKAPKVQNYIFEINVDINVTNFENLTNLVCSDCDYV